MAELSTFIKLDRNILNWGWYTDTNTKSLFIHILLKANVKENSFKGQAIKRGEFVTSLPHLSKELGLSIQSVRTAINHLKSTGEITVKTTSKYSIITVLNYNKYQKITRKSTDEQQTTNRQLTDKQQQSKNKRIKEYKNVRERERENLSNSPTVKKSFGVFSNVYLSADELKKLKAKYPNLYQQKIERLSGYIKTSGKKYKSHYAVLLQWLAEDSAKGKQRGGDFEGNRDVSYDIEELEKIK